MLTIHPTPQLFQPLFDMSADDSHPLKRCADEITAASDAAAPKRIKVVNEEFCAKRWLALVVAFDARHIKEHIKECGVDSEEEEEDVPRKITIRVPITFPNSETLELCVSIVFVGEDQDYVFGKMCLMNDDYEEVLFDKPHSRLLIVALLDTLRSNGWYDDQPDDETLDICLDPSVTVKVEALSVGLRKVLKEAAKKITLKVPSPTPRVPSPVLPRASSPTISSPLSAIPE